MTDGFLQIKGQIPIYYKETPRTASTDWPPRFMKVISITHRCLPPLTVLQFILHIAHRSTKEVTQVAFLDARRLGRVRLCASPLKEEPISTLGFDPILGMPALKEFKPLVQKRSCPVKALLLDQSFSAGIGNWIAGEIHDILSYGDNHTHVDTPTRRSSVSCADSSRTTLSCALG